MDYITFMHGNSDTDASKESWDEFFRIARESGFFRGGSAMGTRTTLGDKAVPDISEHVGGYMKFETDTLDELKSLLSHHPTYLSGGTIEICELPKT